MPHRRILPDRPLTSAERSSRYRARQGAKRRAEREAKAADVDWFHVKLVPATVTAFTGKMEPATVTPFDGVMAPWSPEREGLPVILTAFGGVLVPWRPDMPAEKA